VPQYRVQWATGVGHNKYIDTLHILLHLIFIYLILQINKHIILSDLKENSCFSYVQFVPPRIAEEGKIKRTSGGCTVPLLLLFRTKNVFYLHFRKTFIRKKTL